MMMWPVFLVLGLLISGLGTYIYFFIKRILSLFHVDVKRKPVRISLIVVSVAAAASCLDMSSIVALSVIHIVMLGLLTQLVHFIFRKLSGKHYETKFGIVKKIYLSGIIPLLVTALLMVFGYFNLRNVADTHYIIYTDKNIREEGYRIALIADVHYGVSLSDEELSAKCLEISEQNVDIVLLCGDIVDDSTSRAGMEHAFKTLSTIENTLGIYYVYGNHDRPFYSLDYPFTEEDLVHIMEENGIRILQDEAISVTDDFTIAGREDKSRSKIGDGRASIADLLAETNSDSFILTMDHQPNEYKENGVAGTDLLVSGHTHGGQIWPINLFDKLLKINDAVYGYTKIDNDTQAIVTSGFAGWSYPIKTAAPAEYVIIDIRRNES